MDLLHDLNGRLLFAIPKKGRLYEQTLSLLSGAHIHFHRKSRHDIAFVTNFPIALVFLPAADIAKYVSQGNVDLGITGYDVIEESGDSGKVIEMLDLGFGQCKLQVQVPIKSGIKDVKELQGRRIITSFDRLSKRFFKMIDQEALGDAYETGRRTEIGTVSGSVEAACALGLADGIVDLVESGETMRAAGLCAIATILTTSARLIKNPMSRHSDLIAKITARIQGVIVADSYVLCTYNCRRELLKEAIKITPGRTAPTLSPLEEDGFVSVTVMVKKNDLGDIMDRLKELGAVDVLVMTISNCRV